MQVLMILSILLLSSQTMAETYNTKGIPFKRLKCKPTKLRFTQYGDTRGINGSVVIAPGRTESSLKYEETANDLIQRGYSPIIVTNHRGQGLGDRLLKDPHKGYVENYNCYYRDMARLVRSLRTIPEVDMDRLNLLSHSMGSAISVGYLQKYAKSSPFKKVALVAPMLGIEFHGRTEKNVYLETLLACYIPFAPYCTDYVPGRGPYDPSKDVFEGNDLTHSETRFNFRKRLWHENPKIQLGAPTIRWVKQSLEANWKMRRKSEMRKLKNIPILILQAQKDTVVRNSVQNKFCDKLENCQVHVYQDALHDLLMEIDPIRDPAIEDIASFFL